MFTVLKNGKKIISVFKTDKLTSLTYDGKKAFLEVGVAQLEATISEEDFNRVIEQILKSADAAKRRNEAPQRGRGLV